MLYSADLASFLFNCARKNAFGGGLFRNTTFFGVHAEILLSRVIAPRESFAGPLGVVQKYYFLEKYSPLPPTFTTPPRQMRRSTTPTFTCVH